MKTWAQICKHCTIHQLSENTNYNVKKKKIILFYFFIRAWRYVNRAGRKGVRAGRKGVRAGRKTVRAGCSTLGNRPSWNTEYE